MMTPFDYTSHFLHIACALEEHDWVSDICHEVSTHDDPLVRSSHTMAPSDDTPPFSTRTDGSRASLDHTQYLSVHNPQALTAFSPRQDINATISAASAALFRGQSPFETIGKTIVKGTKAIDHSKTRRQKQKWVDFSKLIGHVATPGR